MSMTSGSMNTTNPTTIVGDITPDTPLPVSITQPVSIANFPATQPVSGSVSVANFPATQPVSGSVSVSNLPVTQPVSGTVAVSNFPASQPVTFSQPITVTSSATQVSSYTYTATNVLLVSIQIAAANANRKGFIIYNNSANSVYVGFATPAVAANCVRAIATFTSWEFMYPICYTGAIYAIRNSGSGACTVWEF